MKKACVTILALFVLLGATGTTTAKATVAAQKRIIWTFYNADSDVYVQYNPGNHTVAQIYLNAWETVTSYGDNSDVEYHPENGGFLYFNTSYMIEVDYGAPEHFNMVLYRVY